jgi:deoxyribose-phosphate aldolase
LRSANATTLIGTVIGFHEGTSSVTKKLEEAEEAIRLGADELDFVLNYSAFKEGDFQLIDQEIIACTKYCLENQKVIKWIIETAALTNEEIVVISQRIREIVLKHFTIASAKNVFVKSSTGFYETANNFPNGATLENMRLIIVHSKPLKIKAAGGIKTFQMAEQMIDKDLIDKKGWGHSSIGQGVEFFNKINCKKMLITHHAPGRTDYDLDKLSAGLPDGIELAYSGMIIAI